MCYSKVREQAMKDIKDDLKAEGKAFIAFRTELNPIMRRIVNEYLKSQKTSICISAWIVKEEEE